MAQQYQIVVSTDPDLNNNAFVKDVALNDEQLKGAATALFALFGSPANSVRIYTPTPNGPMRVDYAILAQQLDTMLLRGPEVNNITSANWLIDLQDSGIGVTKKFSARVLAGELYIVQFSSMEYLGGMIMVFKNCGLDYTKYIVDLHEDGLPVVDELELTG